MSLFASNVLGRVGDGVARMSFDEEFIHGRIRRDVHAPPTHVGVEVVQGSRHFAVHVAAAVKGARVCVCGGARVVMALVGGGVHPQRW